VIGSGPTIRAETDARDALAVCARRGIDVPDHVRAAMLANAPPNIGTGPVHMIATPQDALEAAAARARAGGVDAHIMGCNIEGEARDVATTFAGIADQIRRLDQPVAKPCVLLSGGETTVTVRGNGRGGRNTEFLLALAIALQGAPGVSAIACDTDGIDGVDHNAGAFCLPDTLAKMRAAGVDPRALLDDNDSLAAFEAADQVITTGPTLTNVNDFRAILIA
jgi:glycerate 2-kinase